jgi:hypothetical protein
MRAVLLQIHEGGRYKCFVSHTIIGGSRVVRAELESGHLIQR